MDGDGEAKVGGEKAVTASPLLSLDRLHCLYKRSETTVGATLSRTAVRLFYSPLLGG